MPSTRSEGWPREGSSAPRRLSVLLVEDDLVTLELMRIMLDGLSFWVFPASRFAEAREISQRETIDILITDLTLPDGSGIDLMKELSGRSTVYGIAVSGHDHNDEVNEAGFLHHLMKPIQLDELEAILLAAEQQISSHQDDIHH